MAGLVAYDSSDEEDGFQEPAVEVRTNDGFAKSGSNNSTEQVTPKNSDSRKPSGRSSNTIDSPESIVTRGNGIASKGESKGRVEERQAFGQEQPAERFSPIVGPVLGPSILAEESIRLPLLEEDDVSAPHSPYSTNRALLRQLTVPPIPNLDIPPSPPCSPPPSTNAKFEHFLALKKQGVHFNDKLSKSAALKNPSLMQKLMDFAEIDQADQYTSTLPEDLWDPKAFPDWAYKESLTKSQQQILKKKEEEKLRVQRESLDFVPATASAEPGKTWPASGINGRGGGRSATERVMAGLERPKSHSPQVQAGMKRKTRFES